jgi:hypothetical protein
LVARVRGTPQPLQTGQQRLAVQAALLRPPLLTLFSLTKLVLIPSLALVVYALTLRYLRV